MVRSQLPLMKVFASVCLCVGLAEEASIDTPFHEVPGSKAQLMRTFPENRIDLATIAEMAEYNALVGRTRPVGWPNFETMNARGMGRGMGRQMGRGKGRSKESGKKQRRHNHQNQALEGAEWAMKPEKARHHAGRHPQHFSERRLIKDFEEDADDMAPVHAVKHARLHSVKHLDVAEVAGPDKLQQHKVKLRGSAHEADDSEANFNVQQHSRHKKEKEDGEVMEILEALRKQRGANPEQSQQAEVADVPKAHHEVWDSENALSSVKHVQAEHQQHDSEAKVSAVADVPVPSHKVISDPANSRLKLSKLAWLHIPETGVSFANTLASWACPHLEDKTLVDGSGSASLSHFVEKHQQECSEGFQFCDGHVPMARGSCNDWDEHNGYFVGMFRQPEQRVMAGFNAGCRSLPESECDLKEYARSVAGCSVKMMNGETCGENSTTTGDMVTHAIHRLEEGFSFVGLTEEWGLSVCLFHAMFGGECHEREFENIHPGEHHTELAYDTSELGDWVDPWDTALYEHAYATFWNNVAKYDVTPDSCTKSFCSSVPDAFKKSLLKQG